MELTLSLGEKIPYKHRTITATPKALEVLPSIRDHLIDIARLGQTITYGQLRRDLRLTYPPQGMGRLLDLLSVDCERRGEPSLAAIVVNAVTGEVGDDFDGDAAAERRRLYAKWF